MYSVLNFVRSQFKAILLFMEIGKYSLRWIDECSVHLKIIFNTYSYNFSFQKEDEPVLLPSSGIKQEKAGMMLLCPQDNSQT